MRQKFFGGKSREHANSRHKKKKEKKIPVISHIPLTKCIGHGHVTFIELNSPSILSTSYNFVLIFLDR